MISEEQKLAINIAIKKINALQYQHRFEKMQMKDKLAEIRNKLDLTFEFFKTWNILFMLENHDYRIQYSTFMDYFASYNTYKDLLLKSTPTFEEFMKAVFEFKINELK